MAEHLEGQVDPVAHPQTKPLLYWSNGGPGASSLFGLLTEVGPLWLNEDSFGGSPDSLPTPLYNPHGWTRLGHVVMIDQPAPVGFSYCEDDALCADISWTDELAAENSYRALAAFYDKFPHLLESDLYLTGESYAGTYMRACVACRIACVDVSSGDGRDEERNWPHDTTTHPRTHPHVVVLSGTGIYIPTLARAILKYQDDFSKTSPQNVTIPLLGFAVGDGCLGTETGICSEIQAGDTAIPYWQILFLAGHAQFPLATLSEFFRACKPLEHHSLHDPVSEICRAVVDRIYEQVGGFYEYALYDECTYDDAFNAHGGAPRLKGGLNDYPCGTDRALQAWLKAPAVQEALHLRSTYFAVDNAVGFDYTATEKDLTGFYKSIQGKLKVLICKLSFPPPPPRSTISPMILTLSSP
jgi:hypothetical protein